jgi:outer membrane lipoprotein SlyB
MRIHPLIAVAAASVVVLSGVGVAAITGVLPGTRGEKAAEPPAVKAVTKQTPVASTKKGCPDCGVVVAVKEVEEQGKGTGLGAVVGGVAGAVVGHEITDGKDLGTVVGAAGGAIAGHQIERHARTTKHYEVDVRMADGKLKTVRFATQPAWRSGNRVRVKDGTLTSA